MKLAITLILGSILLTAIVCGAQTTNLPVILQNAPPVVQSIYQRHWPAVTVGLMWLVREAHVWWPFLINSGGVTGVFKLLWSGMPAPKPYAVPPIIPTELNTPKP